MNVNPPPPALPFPSHPFPPPPSTPALSCPGTNVLLTASDRDDRHFVAKVADFGLSRVLQGESVTTRSYGTITHMAQGEGGLRRQGGKGMGLVGGGL